MSSLVSVIIPCFNAASSVAQSIQSALDQTHQPVEVIVIDDGSTDLSLEVIKSFGNRITWETGPHRGAKYARNRGLELARGDYLQFLEADDYLLPEKIDRQMRVLQTAEAEVIYEDWCWREERKDGSLRYAAGISGYHPDVLEALLTKWVPLDLTLLYKRQAFDRNIRWNERPGFVADWELNIRLAVAGVSYGYLTGCFSVMRRPPAPVAFSRQPRLIEDNIVAILQETETRLRAAGNLADRYRRAVAGAYLALACGANQYFDQDRERFEELVGKAQRLSSAAVYPGSPLFALAAKMLGVRHAERVRSWKRRYLKPGRETRPASPPACGAAS